MVCSAHLLLLLIYSSSLTRLHNLSQYRVNEEEGVKLTEESGMGHLHDTQLWVFWYLFYKNFEGQWVLWRNDPEKFILKLLVVRKSYTGRDTIMSFSTKIK